MATAPLSSTTTWSHVYSTSGSRCDDRIRLICLLCAMSRMSSSISSRPFGSMPLVGSSRNSRLGIVDERLRQLDALLHAGRVLLDVAVARLAEADVVEHLVRALHGVGGRQAGQLAAVGDERHGVHPRNVRVVLRHVADACADLQRRRAARRARAPASRRRRARAGPSSALIIVLLPAPFGPSRPTAPLGNVAVTSRSAHWRP